MANTENYSVKLDPESKRVWTDLVAKIVEIYDLDSNGQAYSEIINLVQKSLDSKELSSDMKLYYENFSNNVASLESSVMAILREYDRLKKSIEFEKKEATRIAYEKLDSTLVNLEKETKKNKELEDKLAQVTKELNASKEKIQFLESQIEGTKKAQDNNESILNTLNEMRENMMKQWEDFMNNPEKQTEWFKNIQEQQAKAYKQWEDFMNNSEKQAEWFKNVQEQQAKAYKQWKEFIDNPEKQAEWFKNMQGQQAKAYEQWKEYMDNPEKQAEWFKNMQEQQAKAYKQWKEYMDNPEKQSEWFKSMQNLNGFNPWGNWTKQSSEGNQKDTDENKTGSKDQEE